MALLYFPSHTKSISYVLGIGSGYFLHRYRQRKFKEGLSVWVRVLGWAVSATLMLYAVFGGYKTFQLDSEYDRLFSAFFIGFQRFFWATGLTWVTWMCILGHGGMINAFLSWSVFIPLGRVSYSVYLTHIAVLVASIGSIKSSFRYNDFDQIELYLGDLVLSIASGLVLTLLVEAPMLNVEKLVMARGGNKPSETAAEHRTPATQQHQHIA